MAKLNRGVQLLEIRSLLSSQSPHRHGVSFLCLTMMKCMPFNSPTTHVLHVMRFFLHNLSIFLMNNAIFHSFNYSFNNAVKIFIQRIYSFKKNEKNSFKEFIHSRKMKIIHSKKIFIQVKNGLSPRAISGGRLHSDLLYIGKVVVPIIMVVEEGEHL